MSAPIRRTTLCVVTLMSFSTGLSFAATTDCSPRGDVERTMHHDDSAIRQALIVLSQAVNPIRVVSPEEIREIYTRAGIADRSAGLSAFRRPGDMADPTIYVNKNSLVYRSAAQKQSALIVLKLDATLAHEQVHNTDGEFAAYRLQADFVRSKLNGMPWRQHADARQHLQELDAKARALARADQRGRQVGVRSARRLKQPSDCPVTAGGGTREGRFTSTERQH